MPVRNKTIVIAGGGGFIGRGICTCFDPSNTIYVLGRGPGKPEGLPSSVRYTPWDGKSQGAWTRVLDGADVLINLCGKSVNCRYTPANRQAIFDSRTETTEALGQAVRGCRLPPKVWINAASATIYRHAEDRPQDEYTGEMGNDFSVQVCKKWEKTFLDISLEHTRKVVLRMAIVLGEDSVMQRFRLLVRSGLGGPMGDGRQMFSWVHIEDVARMIEYIVDHPGLSGVYNCAAPGPVTNRAFMHSLRQAMGRRIGLRTPSWLLAFGARLIGTETELILKSRWVLPTRITEAGFRFRYNELTEALKAVSLHHG